MADFSEGGWLLSKFTTNEHTKDALSNPVPAAASGAKTTVFGGGDEELVFLVTKITVRSDGSEKLVFYAAKITVFGRGSEILVF